MVVNHEEIPPPVQSPRPPIPLAEPRIRVRLRAVRDAGSSEALSIGSEGQRLILLHEEGELAEPGNDLPERGLVVKGPVSVRATGSGWSVVDGSGFRARVGGGFEPLLIRVFRGRGEETDSEEGLISLDGVNYRGWLRVVPRTDAGARSFDVVNVVRLEDYLPGVLAKELYGHWGEETHAAQAVAARSFACSEMYYFRRTRHFDVTNNASSQMYGGAAAGGRAREGVSRTRGMVLGWEGFLVPGYYSACCGGLAADARHAIGLHPANDITPLRGREGEEDVCTGLPVCRWSVERSREEAEKRLRAYGKDRAIPDLAGLGELASIAVADQNKHGRPTRYEIGDESGGIANVSEHSLRRGLDYEVKGYPAPEKMLKSGFLTGITMGRSKMALNGRGWGHGAGLCQYGAEQLAKQGKTAEEILGWYYPGAEVRRGYV